MIVLKWRSKIPYLEAMSDRKHDEVCILDTKKAVEYSTA
jgi:hypothetical protein